MIQKQKEQVRAAELSAAIDGLLNNSSVELEDTSKMETGLVDMARQLSRLPAMLGPVSHDLEQRVLGMVENTVDRPQPKQFYKGVMAVAAVAATLFLVMAFSPMGHTAMASFMAVFNLGRTEVRITPANDMIEPSSTAEIHATAVQEALSLSEAQGAFGFVIPQPVDLPEGFDLQGTYSYSYPDLPAWVPQPFFLELVYQEPGGKEMTLRVYPIMLGDRASISGMDLQAKPIQSVEDVEIDGQPGVLLTLGSQQVPGAWHEIVWEQGDLILALSATELGPDTLLKVAGSVE